MARSTVSLYVCPESSFGVDPDATGAAYLAAQVMGRPFYKDDISLVASNYATGRNRDTGSLIGADGASISLDVPLVSLSALHADGASATTADWLDAILTAAFGTATVRLGNGLTSGGSTTSMVTDAASEFLIEELALVQYSNHSEWRYITAVPVAGATYTIAPALSGAYSASLDAIGYRYWAYTDTAGASCALYTQVGGNGYLLTGGRPGIKISMAAGEPMIKVSTSWKCDAKTATSTPASLPSVSAFSNTPIKSVLSPVYFAGTEYTTKMVEIDWQQSPTDIKATSGTNGRANIENMSAFPKVTLEVPFSTTLETAFRAGTEGPLLVQLGSGLVGGGRANTCAFYAPSAQVIDVQPSDDSNYLRHKVTLQVTDRGIRTGSTPYPYWMFARA